MANTSRSAILLSVRPKHMNKILAGEKIVEIRRIRPQISSNATILFYASSPEKQLAAIARITDVKVSSPRKLWASSGKESALTRKEFLDYLSGCSKGVSISFADLVEIEPPIALSELRSIWPSFHPPQTHIFISESQVEELGHVNCLSAYPLDTAATFS